MLERITSADSIWQNPPYLAEESLFLLLRKLCLAENGLFLTDRQSILLAQTAPDLGAWVWTAPDIAPGQVATLREAIAAHNIRRITARPEVAMQAYAPVKLVERLLGNECPALRMPQGIDGACSRHTAYEDAQIAHNFARFNLETGHADGPEPYETYLPTAENARQSDDFAIWRNAEGSIVAMARISLRTARYACINAVYTEPSHRGKGYAGAVVGALCARILEEGRTPMLYTDGAYPSSNRAYQKIGFVPIGALAITTKG